ncbi:MAG: hypothetical protein NVS9B9_12490 [Ktedonobacteraceae bacterium]
MVPRLRMWYGTSQIMKESSHTHNEAVSLFLLGNREGECIHSTHMLPAMRKIIYASETLLYLRVHGRQHL